MSISSEELNDIFIVTMNRGGEFPDIWWMEERRFNEMCDQIEAGMSFPGENWKTVIRARRTFAGVPIRFY